jgi:hypothetical protein
LVFVREFAPQAKYTRHLKPNDKAEVERLQAEREEGKDFFFKFKKSVGRSSLFQQYVTLYRDVCAFFFVTCRFCCGGPRAEGVALRGVGELGQPRRGGLLNAAALDQVPQYLRSVARH